MFSQFWSKNSLSPELHERVTLRIITSALVTTDCCNVGSSDSGNLKRVATSFDEKFATFSCKNLRLHKRRTLPRESRKRIWTFLVPRERKIFPEFRDFTRLSMFSSVLRVQPSIEYSCDSPKWFSLDRHRCEISECNVPPLENNVFFASAANSFRSFPRDEQRASSFCSEEKKRITVETVITIIYRSLCAIYRKTWRGVPRGNRQTL